MALFVDVPRNATVLTNAVGADAGLENFDPIDPFENA
jgi:hypothetical protein